ncbi:MAG: hypothetical protein JXM68_04115 [Sedimentisphaerales bacterium]|nr:hypothetical protein [Sedimentisphaerales bacterium]
MNDIIYNFNLLAQAASDADTAARGTPENANNMIVTIDQIWTYLESLNWIQSMAAITIATIFLFYGYRLFRLLVTLNFVFAGMLLGRYIGGQLGSAMWGGILGFLSLGCLPYPFMKYCVSILGGLAGAAIGMTLQRGIVATDVFLLSGSGAIAGLVAGAFLAFSSFKNTVMLFTSLQGSACLLIGILSLIKNQTPLSGYLRQYIFDIPIALPALLCSIVVFGVFIQTKFMAQEGKWKMPADEGWKRN